MKRIVSTLLLSVGLFAYAGAGEARPFVVGVGSTTLTFNPLHTYTSTEAQLYTAFYEGLVTYHPFSLDPQPGVAERWEVSEDGTVYRFYLRGDARYTNGDAVLARHFVETWLKLIHPQTKGEYASLLDVVEGARDYRLGRSRRRDSVGIRAVSDRVLEVRLAQPAPHFLKVLCHHSFVPVHPSLVNVTDWRNESTIVGNGAFSIQRHDQSEMVLAKNEHYWDAESVSVDELRIVFVSDASMATQQYNLGQIDWLMDGISMEALDNDDAVVVNSMFATQYYYVATRQAPWSDPRVREALALLVPWEEVREGYPIPASTLVPKIPGYPEFEGILEPDAARARDLLEEAGFPGGRGLPTLTFKIPQGPESRRIASVMADAWENAIGLTVRVLDYPYSRYYDELKAQDYTIGTITWIGDFADPYTFLQMWQSDSNLNDAGYRNKEYDNIVERASALTGEERYELFAEAERMILEEGTVLPISHSPALNVIDLERIEGWYPNALDIHPMKYLAFAERPPMRGVASREETDSEGTS
jgi:peptide/nickel transport system substrate-binding protein/oligopeptide transport system substrate-binding protein